MSIELSALAHPSHGRLLDIIRAEGPISRVEIAQRSGMTAASVTNIVRLLLDLELVREVGRAESTGGTGGKRRTLLAIAPESRYAVGVHVQHTTTTSTVSDMAGRMVGRRSSHDTRAGDGDSLVDRLVHDVDGILDDLGIDRRSVVGVGVTGGRSLVYPSSSNSRDRAAAPLIGAPELSRALALPVVIDREAIAAAIGEFWQGTASQSSAFACLYMGEHLGCGVVNAGAVWRGSVSNAGDIGHISLDDQGPPCTCGNRGCLQAIASPDAVVAVADAAGVEAGSPSDPVQDRFDALARRAVRGEAKTRELIVRSADALARVAVILTSVLDVEMFILAGPGFAVPGAIYAERLRAALAEHAARWSTPPVAVELAHNPRDAAAVGASALVLQGALAPRA
jgi:predicted NBD/HSP70 family sugar kinase